MSVVAALAVAAGIFLLIASRPGERLGERVGRYLHPDPAPVRPDEATPGRSPLAAAGLTWSATDVFVRRAMWVAAGSVTGALLARGDLFIRGPGRSTLGLVTLGAAAGWLGFNMWISTRTERRSRLLRFELPIVTDALSLHIIAGESIVTAIQNYVNDATGVAADELETALTEVDAGRGIAEALQRNVRRTADPEAARLYTLLAHAHDTGGRLADALGDLGTDYRASLARDLTAEGGKRALATYGPVLALMVPVTLLFLLFPTLAGLRSLAGGP
jgi:tight adherence protein C